MNVGIWGSRFFPVCPVPCASVLVPARFLLAPGLTSSTLSSSCTSPPPPPPYLPFWLFHFFCTSFILSLAMCLSCLSTPIATPLSIPLSLCPRPFSHPPSPFSSLSPPLPSRPPPSLDIASGTVWPCLPCLRLHACMRSCAYDIKLGKLSPSPFVANVGAQQARGRVSGAWNHRCYRECRFVQR